MESLFRKCAIAVAIIGFASSSYASIASGIFLGSHLNATHNIAYRSSAFFNTDGALLISSRTGSLSFMKINSSFGSFPSSNFSSSNRNTGGKDAAGWEADAYTHAIERPTNGVTTSSILMQQSDRIADVETKTSNMAIKGCSSVLRLAPSGFKLI